MSSFSLFMTSTLLMVVATAAATVNNVPTAALGIGVTVNIVNNFPAKGLGIKVQIHCKSGDDDLGIKVVGPGERFSFSFSPNLFETTLFYCNVFRTDPNGVVRFKAYDYHRDATKRCTSKCDWSIGGTGALGTDQSTGRQDLAFPWEATIVY